jgi:phenylpropionate dioxygenase-like ring-hydroxylating dioxygenase large terminal subunit
VNAIIERIESGETIPSSWYTDPAILELERTRVFAKGWQYAGDAGKVAEPGSFFVTTSGQLPVIVTRDEDGELHAFANVCRHRGHIVAEGHGRRKTLQCPYHGWTYRLDGQLHRAPGTDVPDRCEIALREFRADQWGPWLFVSQNRDVEPLAAHLAAAPDRVREIGGLDVDTLAYRTTLTLEFAANWKIVIENFSECYHCPVVHPVTLPALTIDPYSLERFEWMDIQTTGQDGKSREGSRFVFLSLFPNTQYSVFGEAKAVVARAIRPLASDQTVVDFDVYFADEVTDEEAAEFVEFFDIIAREDERPIAQVQRGLSTGVFEHGYISGHPEQAPWELHRRLARALTA